MAVTLREIFNAILDYPIRLNEFDFEHFMAGAVITIAVLVVVYMWFNHYDGDNGWHT